MKAISRVIKNLRKVGNLKISSFSVLENNVVQGIINVVSDIKKLCPKPTGFPVRLRSKMKGPSWRKFEIS